MQTEYHTEPEVNGSQKMRSGLCENPMLERDLMRLSRVAFQLKGDARELKFAAGMKRGLDPDKTKMLAMAPLRRRGEEGGNSEPHPD